MSIAKKILLIVLVGSIAIQFIQPARNKNGEVLSTDFARVFAVPNNVGSILQTACYDCHSNNTNYPWYSNIQPVGWLLARHIRQGKAALNFSEFGSYSPRRQISKLTEIANSIGDGIMPISSYKWMHRNASLSNDQKVIIINWVQHSRDSLESNN